MFRNAWNLGSISGIKIRLHWSFLIVPFMAYYSNIAQGQSMALIAVMLVLAVFGCVLLHELGHAFAARQFGIGTRDILLLPIGGVASLERMPRNPFQELWIAIAGPLVNVVIAVSIFFGLAYSIVPISDLVGSFLTTLAWINLFLVAFNLIPAFPMDGGRVLRSILAMFMSFVKATTIAATVGKFCAIGLAAYGLFSGQFMLMLLAGFVYLAGQAEKMMVLRSQRANFNPAHQATAFEIERPDSLNGSTNEFGQKEICVPSTLSGDSVAAWLSNMRAEYCSIVESGRVIGRMTKAQLLAALSRGVGNLPIGQILMQRQS